MRLNSILLIASLITGTFSVAQAQNTGVQIGPKVGLSLAQLSGQINQRSSFKPGLLLGGFLRWRLTERIALQPELVYSRQGTINRADYLGHEAESRIQLDYVNIPLLAKVYLGKVFNVQFGPQFGLLLSGQRMGQYGYYTSSTGSGYLTEDVDVSDQYKNDFALCGGLGIDLPSGLLATVRINYGLSDIDSNSASIARRQALGIGGVYNRTIECSLGYALSGKK